MPDTVEVECRNSRCNRSTVMDRERAGSPDCVEDGEGGEDE